ncbi:hypothetical protein MAR621_00171 [Maribacter dokdonensis]|uniref:hypothetical protein n=1 Tax=Maribacter dokdonensis TaxID=320912 RepID=UPI001B2B31A0|nr:hypothetical protein [Maribacter dokdonensis]CAG2535057.1 hypothetical protein MAR621_00171 [Maribacter dokdonensis]
MTVKELHREAMRFNDLAIIAKRNNPSVVVEYFQQAFEFEKQAFIKFNSESDVEPTRTILLRSAANLALLATLPREAEKLIAIGLAGDPPDELANELRDILQQVNFFRHLETKGVELDTNEIQLSLSGNEVGHGIIRSNEFLNRIEIIEKLAFRTADRLRNKPFKERGRKKKANVVEFEPFLSVPRAASFAVTIRFGHSTEQQTIPGADSQFFLIDDLLNNIELLNEGNYEKLNTSIKEEDYRRNFIALLKQLAPDGERIKLVGFTVKRNNEIKTVPLTRIKTEFLIEDVESSEEIDKPENIELTGVLSFADSKKSTIKLTDSDNKDYIITVPKGLLSDVVKPYFEEEVILKGIMTGSKIELKDLEMNE